MMPTKLLEKSTNPPDSVHESTYPAPSASHTSHASHAPPAPSAPTSAPHQ